MDYNELPDLPDEYGDEDIEAPGPGFEYDEYGDLDPGFDDYLQITDKDGFTMMIPAETMTTLCRYFSDKVVMPASRTQH